MNELFQTMWHTWSNGGLVMAAMALLAVGMYAMAFQLLMRLSYRGITRASDTVLRRWVVQPAQAPERLRELIRYTQDEVHSVRDIEGRFREVEATQSRF
jgi:cytochrome b